MISGTELARSFPETAARVVVTAEREGGDVVNAWDVLISAVGVDRAKDLVQAARQAAPVEPLPEPCSVQDTTAAALIPGDVVLGPDGWVIVERVDTLSASGYVCIHGIGGIGSIFDRTFDAPVTVQPDADTTSSASRQHFIDTGRYLVRQD